MTDTIDRDTFRALQDAAGADFVGELVATFLEEAPKMLATLREALAAGDADAFRRTAHSLKSNALTFGAQSLAAKARELEATAREAVAAGDAKPLDALADELRRTGDALKEQNRA
jgi:HPt (histidine-containing phosphotransfer) domain-containing protein